MKNVALLLALFILPLSVWAGTSTINTTNSYAWGANIGWLNWRPDPTSNNSTGVRIEEFICSGWIWAANVGWINMGNGFPPSNGHVQYSNTTATDFGVNYSIDSQQPGYGILRGFAYGANIGWINFESTGNPRIRFTDGALEGYAYSANCGWINLGDMTEHNLKTDHLAMGVDSDGDGIADAWEYIYFGNLTTANGTSDNDHDGVSDVQEYKDGTNPTLNGDDLAITTFAKIPTPLALTFRSTTGRLYFIDRNPDLLQAWAADPTWGLPFSPDAGSSTTRTVTASGTKYFYRVQSVRPLP
jgi:Bacterial TSP3 repeat